MGPNKSFDTWLDKLWKQEFGLGDQIWWSRSGSLYTGVWGYAPSGVQGQSLLGSCLGAIPFDKHHSLWKARKSHAMQIYKWKRSYKLISRVPLWLSMFEMSFWKLLKSCERYHKLSPYISDSWNKRFTSSLSSFLLLHSFYNANPSTKYVCHKFPYSDYLGSILNYRPLTNSYDTNRITKFITRFRLAHIVVCLILQCCQLQGATASTLPDFI